MQQQINLYQPSTNFNNEPFSAIMLLSLTGFTCALMMVFYATLFWQKKSLQDELITLRMQFEETTQTVEKLESTVASLTDSKKEQQRLQLLKKLFISKQSALTELSTMVRGNDTGLSTYYSALARKNIEPIWFETIDIYSGGQQMRLRGQTTDAKYIPGFVSSLKEESAFDGVNFKLFKVQKNDDNSSLNFLLQTEDDKTEQVDSH